MAERPVPRPSERNRRKHGVCFILQMVILLVLLICIIALLCYILLSPDDNEIDDNSNICTRMIPNHKRKTPSRLRFFRKSAVCTDAHHCSRVGNNILRQNGTAVDATIAAMFCNGLYNHMSMGVGGGFIMTIYKRSEKQAYSIIATETAPFTATRDMFNNTNSKSHCGPLSSAVLGEVKGMWLAYKRWGKLPWKTLLAPTLNICKTGFPISKPMHEALVEVPDLKNDPQLRQMYIDANGEPYPAGKTVMPMKNFCKTIHILAEKGGDELYKGSLAKVLAEDFKQIGSIITLNDLQNYKAKLEIPIAFKLGTDTLFVPPPPSCGIIVAFILNILKGYKFNAGSIKDLKNNILTHHRIIEAFKYANQVRTELADKDFVDLKGLLKKLLSEEYGKQIRLRINDSFSSNDNGLYRRRTRGTYHETSQLSVLAKNGDAVSVTSSINSHFGAGYTTSNTGIVMNNVMEEFSLPTDDYPTPNNYIQPRKRPRSNMSPCIFVNKEGKVKMVIGAAGSEKIISAVAVVIIRKLWLGQSIKAATDEYRFHQEILPMIVEYEEGMDKSLLQGLRDQGHVLQTYKGRGSVTCGVCANDTVITGNADFRKGGDVVGD